VCCEIFKAEHYFVEHLVLCATPAEDLSTTYR